MKIFYSQIHCKKNSKIFTAKFIVKTIRKPHDFHEILRKTRKFQEKTGKKKFASQKQEIPGIPGISRENAQENLGFGTQNPGKPGFSMFLCAVPRKFFGARPGSVILLPARQPTMDATKGSLRIRILFAFFLTQSATKTFDLIANK